MFRRFSRKLTEDEISGVERAIREAAGEGDGAGVDAGLGRLMPALPLQKSAAVAALRLVEDGCLSSARALDVLTRTQEGHGSDLTLLCRIGRALEDASEIDFLNRPSPDHPLYETVFEALSRAAAKNAEPAQRARILHGLGTAGRMMARQHDAATEQAYRTLVELEPDKASAQYQLGLFYKTRGAFAKGVAANLRARDLAQEPWEACEWNLGICATGAGAGDVALKVWQAMGQKIAMGRFDLPEGRYPSCKVRLAERPLAERSAESDDPGQEETIWVERLSPCHGVVRSVLFHRLGVDYGDAVLFDGAPITCHRYGEDEVPVFPHLATLRRGGFRFFDFAGTQTARGQLSDIGDKLAGDAVVYSHSEQFVTLCATCWSNPELDHERHDTAEKHVVRGRIAAPPGLAAAALLAELDGLLEGQECKIYTPQLCAAAGHSARADVEVRRFDMLVGN